MNGENEEVKVYVVIMIMNFCANFTQLNQQFECKLHDAWEKENKFYTFATPFLRL